MTFCKERIDDVFGATAAGDATVFPGAGVPVQAELGAQVRRHNGLCELVDEVVKPQAEPPSILTNLDPVGIPVETATPPHGDVNGLAGPVQISINKLLVPFHVKGTSKLMSL